MLDVLAVERLVDDPSDPLPEPPAGVPLVDPRSGLVLEPGVLTCLVSASPEETSALADRLGRLVETSGVMLGETPLDRLPLDVVRRRILVSEPDPLIFSGALRGELDPWSRATDDEILAAIGVASAEDVLAALPEGLDEIVDERGRSFSGGQRQRLVLARALLAGTEILVLVEPTSAVDAHTEARIAAQLHDARAGQTTVIVTTSPLVLDRADTVVLVADGCVQATGTHRELLRANPIYRDIVTRGESL
jgi:ABC-type multidrug transport system fused ATPase/permease subunit